MANLATPEEPFPWRGLNDAVSPVNMEPGYTPEAHDLVLDEPGAIRPRFGWSRSVNLSAPLDHGREMPVGYLRRSDFPNSVYLISHVIPLTSSEAYLQPHTAGPDNVDMASRARLNTTGVAITDGSLVRKMMPYGHPVWYLDRDYSVSVGEFSRFLSQSATTAYTEAGVVTWNGSTNSVQNYTFTIANGASSGTLSSAPSGDLSGMYMVVTDTTGGEVAGHKYLYEINADLSSGATLVLTEPYGLGDSASDVPNITTKTVTLMPIGYLPNAPAAQAVASWRDRLWAVGKTYNQPPARVNETTVSPVLAWSEVADRNRWPAANYIQLDATDDVTAMAATSDALYIFTAQRTLMVTGGDESSFQLDVLFDNVGCLHKGGCITHMNSVYVMAHDGVYRIQGGQAVNLCRGESTAGVPNTYRTLVGGGSSIAADFDEAGLPWLHVHRDNLFVTYDRMNGTTFDNLWRDTLRPLPLVHNMTTGAWSTWGPVSNRRHIPGMMYTLGDTAPQLYGASRTGYYKLDQCWDNEPVVEGITTPAFLDEVYTNSIDTADIPVASTFSSRDFMFADGQTTRIQSIQVEHGCRGGNGSVLPWAVTLDYDQDIDSTSVVVGSVKARGSSTSRSKYYTDNFTDVAFPTEGMVFRTRFVFTGDDDLASGKLYRQRFHILRQATKPGRVDNS